MSAIDKEGKTDEAADAGISEDVLVDLVPQTDMLAAMQAAAMQAEAAKAGVTLNPLDIQTPEEKAEWEEVHRAIYEMTHPHVEEEEIISVDLSDRETASLQGRYVSVPARPHRDDEGYYTFRTHSMFEFSALDGIGSTPQYVRTDTSSEEGAS